MGLPVSFILIAVGAVLAFAVHQDSGAAVNVHAVGWVLLAVGLFGLLLSLFWWERWGPGYWTRGPGPYDGPAGGTYDAAAAPGYRRGCGYGRRRRIVEEDAPAGPPGPYDAPPPP